MEDKKQNWGIINKVVAPINLKPHCKSEMVDEGLFGMVVKIIHQVDVEWYYIETHYGYSGYIHRKDLLFVDDDGATSWKEKAQYFITKGIVDVMAEPSYKSYILEVLTRGAMIGVTGNEKDGWSEILMPNDKRGWVRSSFIKQFKELSLTENEETIRKNLVETALSYIGTQYRWGGKSPFGIDCSGLCSISYLLNGIIIYRDAVLKEEYMRKIDIENMKPGDLLFFLGHVAMYIGNNRFVHSTSSLNGVVINSLDSKDDDYKEDLANNILCIGTVFT